MRREILHPDQVKELQKKYMDLVEKEFEVLKAVGTRLSATPIEEPLNGHKFHKFVNVLAYMICMDDGNRAQCLEKAVYIDYLTLRENLEDTTQASIVLGVYVPAELKTDHEVGISMSIRTVNVLTNLLPKALPTTKTG